MNYVNLTGNLTDEPKATTFENGTMKCEFRIAVRRRFTNRQGEREADFLTVVTWRKLAENCCKYLAKGRKCAVHGSIQTRSYDAKDGSGKRYITEIVADDVEFLGIKPQQSAFDSNADAVPDSETEGFYEIDDAELPF